MIGPHELSGFDRYDFVSVFPGEPRIKIDLSTPVETLWGGVTVLAGAGALVTGYLALTKGGLTLGVAVGLGMVAAVFGLLWYSTDNYYVFDFRRREVLYRRNFFGLESLRRVASFDGVAGFGVNCRNDLNKYGTFSEYWVEMILQGGKAVVLTDRNVDALHTCNNLASQLAETVGAQIWKGKLQRPMQVSVDSHGKTSVTHS